MLYGYSHSTEPVQNAAQHRGQGYWHCNRSGPAISCCNPAVIYMFLSSFLQVGFNIFDVCWYMEGFFFFFKGAPVLIFENQELGKFLVKLNLTDQNTLSEGNIFFFLIAAHLISFNFVL